jgi:hypothetical protein
VSALVERLRSAPRGELVGLGLLAATLAASVIWHPQDDGGFVVCPFRKATGLPCPGCGLTRSFCAVAKGHLERAFEFHALGPALFVVLLVYLVRGGALVAGAESAVARFDAAVRRWRLLRIGTVALLAVWIVELVRLGVDGRLAELARHGELTRWLF